MKFTRRGLFAYLAGAAGLVVAKPAINIDASVAPVPPHIGNPAPSFQIKSIERDIEEYLEGMQYPPKGPSPTVRQILQENDHPFTAEEYRKSREFYMGYQWPISEHRKRYKGGRWNLTLNHLPAIVMNAVLASEAIQEPVSVDDLDQLKAVVARRYHDEQVAYNYFQAELSFIRSIKPTPKFVMKNDLRNL